MKITLHKALGWLIPSVVVVLLVWLFFPSAAGPATEEQLAQMKQYYGLLQGFVVLAVLIAVVALIAYAIWRQRRSATHAHPPAAIPAAGGAQGGMVHNVTQGVKANLLPIAGGLLVIAALILYFRWEPDPHDIADFMWSHMAVLTLIALVLGLPFTVRGYGTQVRWVIYAVLATLAVITLLGDYPGFVKTLRGAPPLSVSTQALRGPSVLGPCQESTPCAPVLLADGTTTPQNVWAGSKVCFDGAFWTDLPDLGFSVSYRGSPEKTYDCTESQIGNGSCQIQSFDRFRFKPRKQNVNIPKHWFVPYNSQC